MASLDFEMDADGNRRLADRRFEGVTFGHLDLNPAQGTKVILERVQFSRCRTDPGTCWISAGTTLSDVVIEDLDCGDALRISSNCDLERVVLRRQEKSCGLIVRPFDGDDLEFRQSTDDWCMDITDFHGHEVEVVGIPVNKIRIDPTRHVVVNSSWKTDVDWTALGLNRLGFVGIVTRKLQSFKVAQGIYSLPNQKTNRAHYEEARRELEILRKEGGSFA